MMLTLRSGNVVVALTLVTVAAYAGILVLTFGLARDGGA
jgi:hypothetical protein